MISIKKYLDIDEQEPPIGEPNLDGLFCAAVDSYRALLLALGRSAVQIVPGLGAEFDRSLQGFEKRLTVEPTAEQIKLTEGQVEAQLDRWGARTADYVTAQADVVKELLAALAKTAESMGTRDRDYSSQFRQMTGRLEQIAHLEDLSQIRLSLAKSVTELRSSVDQMARESQQLVAQLRSELTDYETKLKSVEQYAMKDDLTGLANRRCLEERVQGNIALGQQFCVVMLDLNRFKEVNDRHGHLVGDDLLKQFAMELQSNLRSCDLVGRWGGDEFMAILSCNAHTARSHVDRIREWVFGKYMVRGVGQNPLAIPMDASIGVGEWRKGRTMQQLIAEADAAMYADKKKAKGK